MANPGSKKIATHPQSTPQAIPLSMKGILFGLLVKVARGVFLSGVLKQLYRKNTPTIYTLSVWRSGSVNGVYTCIPLIYCLLGGYMLPIPPTNREPETTIVTGAVFWCHRNIRSPAMLVCGFPRCQWV